MFKYAYGWNIVAFGILMQIFSMGIFLYAFGVVLLPWSDDFGVGRAELAMLPVILQVVMSFASPFAGYLIDRFPARILVSLGTLLVVVSLVLVSLARSMAELVTVHVVLMTVAILLGGSLMSQTLAARWFRHRLGLALAITAAGGGLGGLIMPPLVQFLIEEFGWRLGYQYLALAAALLLLPPCLLLRLAPREAEVMQSSVTAMAAAPETAAPTSIWSIVGDRIFLMVTIGLAVVSAVQLALQYNFPAMGRDVGISATRSAWIISMLFATSLLGKPVWGVLVDRVQPRLIFLSIALAYSMSLAVVVGLFGNLGYLHFVAAAIAAGSTNGAIQPLLGVVLIERFGRASFGRVLGFAYPVLNLSAAGPAIAAFSYSHTGSYQGGFLVMLAVTLTSAVIVTLGMRLQPARPSGDALVSA